MEKLKEMYYGFINSEEYRIAGDVKEVNESRERLYEYIENNFHDKTIYEVEYLTASVASAYEMQGYIRGYKNAMEILLACGIKVGDVV